MTIQVEMCCKVSDFKF